MKTEELRLGNWFTDKYTNDKLQVVTLSKDCVVFDYETNREWQAEPIPLTDKILLKCGFTRQGDDFVLDADKGLLFVMYEDELDAVYLYKTFTNARNFIQKVKYLHQLQNLFYAIIGEELEVEL